MCTSRLGRTYRDSGRKSAFWTPLEHFCWTAGASWSLRRPSKAFQVRPSKAFGDLRRPLEAFEGLSRTLKAFEVRPLQACGGLRRLCKAFEGL